MIKAIRAYETLRSDERIGFISEEPANFERQWLEYARAGQPSPQRWMDAYLAAFARQAGMTFVTFDRGLTQFPGLEVIVLRVEG